MSAKKIKVLFVANGGPQYFSSKVRVYDYLLTWEAWGVEASCIAWKATSSPGDLARACSLLMEKAKGVDIVYLHRSFLPSKIISEIKRMGSAMVWDFDDALYHVPSIQCSPIFPQARSFQEKIKQLYRRISRGDPYYSSRKKHLDEILSLSDGVVAGNSILAQYSRKLVSQVEIAPTPVDIMDISDEMLTGSPPSGRLTIGWMGSPDNLCFLEAIAPAFEILSQKYTDQLQLLIVSKPTDGLQFPGLQTVFKPWSWQEDRALMSSFDIGIMPLTDDGWSRGKCGYKALKCMGYGVPVVASPVGINSDFIREGVNGFLATSIAEWVCKLSLLIDDPALRASMGAAAKETVKQDFSRPVLQEKIARFLHHLA